MCEGKVIGLFPSCNIIRAMHESRKILQYGLIKFNKTLKLVWVCRVFDTGFLDGRAAIQ